MGLSVQAEGLANSVTLSSHTEMLITWLTQTINIQNFAQGSIENIETNYSSQVPGSRNLSRPLSREHSYKVMR